MDEEQNNKNVDEKLPIIYLTMFGVLFITIFIFILIAFYTKTKYYNTEFLGPRFRI